MLPQIHVLKYQDKFYKMQGKKGNKNFRNPQNLTQVFFMDSTHVLLSLFTLTFERCSLKTSVHDIVMLTRVASQKFNYSGQ